MPNTRPVQSAFSARTAFPHADFDSYVFTFIKEGTTSAELTPDNNGYFTLEVGNYTVELQAFIDSTLVTSGVSDQFTVLEGDNDPVVVYLSPVPSTAPTEPAEPAEPEPPITLTTLTRTVKIDMFDSGSNGWGNGAISVNVNGNEITTVKVISGSTDTYTFQVTIGDVVQLYWLAGPSQGDNSFIVYYTDTPPIPAFNTDSNLFWNGSNALIYRSRNAMKNTNGGESLGSFTVQNEQ